MPQLHILIVDEIPDFAKSLGSLIIDLLSIEDSSIKYTFNIEDGIQLIRKDSFNFIFIGLNSYSETIEETLASFKKLSVNPEVQIISLTNHNKPIISHKQNHKNNFTCLAKDELDIDSLKEIFIV